MERVFPTPDNGNSGDSDRFVRSLDYARRIKAKYEALLLRNTNVISVGIGLSPMAADMEIPRQPVLVICVRQTLSADTIPAELEGVPVTIQVSGDIRAF